MVVLTSIYRQRTPQSYRYQIGKKNTIRKVFFMYFRNKTIIFVGNIFFVQKQAGV